MKKQGKLWATGVVSAVVAACSGLWPAAATTICANSFCGVCSGGCFSGLGLFWLGSLYLSHFVNTVKHKVNGLLSQVWLF